MSRLREAALVLGAYLVLTWLCLHPLFVHPASTAVDPVVPGGGGPIGLADVNLAIWKVAWACHALWSDPARLFEVQPRGSRVESGRIPVTEVQ